MQQPNGQPFDLKGGEVQMAFKFQKGIYNRFKKHKINRFHRQKKLYTKNSHGLSSLTIM